MRISVDVDGGLLNSEKFQFEKGKEYFKKDPINKKGYDIYEIFEVSQLEDLMFWRKYLKDYTYNIDSNKDASEVTKKLKDNGNEIYIITARANKMWRYGFTVRKMKKAVIGWLKKENIYYDKLIFSKEDKEKFIRENKIDIMIEDRPRNIIALSKIIPVICYVSNYNEHIKGNNIFKANNWNEVYNIIEKFDK